MRPCGFRWRNGGWHPRSDGRHRRHDTEPGWFSHVRLYRDPVGGKIRGVCAGIADYFGIAPFIIRVLWLIALFVNPMLTLIAYFLLSWLLPDKPADLFTSPEEEVFWKQVRTEPVGTVHELRHRIRTNEHRLRAMEAYVTSSEFELNRELRDL